MASDRIFQFLSIDRSPIITLEGKELVDLLATPIQVPDSNEKTIAVVDKKLAGKPHLISKILCDSHNYIDLLFSYNGISNPLTVKGGDILVVPPTEVFSLSMGARIDNASMESLTKRVAETSKTRLSFLKTETETVKTPNMNENGEQFIKRGRSVFLGKTSSSSSDAVSDVTNKMLQTIMQKISKNDRRTKSNERKD